MDDQINYKLEIEQLSGLASMLVTSRTYDRGASAKENKSHTHRNELDSNAQPGGWHHSVLTDLDLLEV